MLLILLGKSAEPYPPIASNMSQSPFSTPIHRSGLRRSDEGTKMKPRSSDVKSPAKAPAERVVKDIRR
ncbi:hypothetical protein, partial [Sphingomonas sp. CCH9-H8]|uniref:hypothetical protein n=1 Tax=Sphingomonas sp. CCH9-H8 TaxID=1768772 RepID=UPI001E40EEED